MIFVCDTMLGKLARYLRMLGLDTQYARSGSFPFPSGPEGREIIFFTRRRERPEAGVKTVFIGADDPAGQLRLVRPYIDAHVDPGALMSRCLDCNALLADVPRNEIEQFVPEYIYHHHDRFTRCPSCRKVYWEGSHARNMRAGLKGILGAGQETEDD